MAKKLIMFSLRLLLLYVVADLVVALFFTIQNTVVQICIDALFILVLWYFVWRDAMNIGLKDSQKDKILKQKKEEEGNTQQHDERKAFAPWFGFAAGFISQIPTFALAGILVFSDTNGVLYGVLKPIINLWNYYILYIQNGMPALFPYVFVIASVLFCIVSGLAYLNGPRELKRIETIIERNVARGARRVQDEWKAEKKRKKHGNRR